MIAVALLWVWYAHEEPYMTQHTWMSEGELYAPVELVDWMIEMGQDVTCSFKIIRCFLQERQDIGW